VQHTRGAGAAVQNGDDVHHPSGQARVSAGQDRDGVLLFDVDEVDEQHHDHVTDLNLGGRPAFDATADELAAVSARVTGSTAPSPRPRRVRVTFTVVPDVATALLTAVSVIANSAARSMLTTPPSA
jgi:hypothetical protein